MDAIVDNVTVRIQRISNLNPTELSVATLLSRGLDDDEIARRLDRTTVDIGGIVDVIYSKLGFDSTIQLFERRALVGKIMRAWELGKSAKASTSTSASDALDSSALLRHTEELRALGIDIAKHIALLPDLDEQQKETLSCLVCGVRTEGIATKLGRTTVAIDSMLGYIGKLLEIPASLEKGAGNAFVKGVGLWAVGQHKAAVEIFRTLASQQPDTADNTDQEGLGASPDDLVFEIAGKIGFLTPKLREVARCFAENADVGKTLSLTDGTVKQYVSSLFSAVGLPASFGRERRVRIVAAAHRIWVGRGSIVERQGRKVRDVNATSGITIINRGASALLGSHGTVVDISDEKVPQEAGAAAEVIARWAKEGYVPVEYVIDFASRERYIVFAKHQNSAST